jgi:serine protease Do
MSNRVLRPLALMGLFVLLVSLACNIGSNPTPTSAPTSEQATQVEATQPTGPTSATAARGAAVSSLDDLQSAVIQIEAEGTFIDPEVGLVVNGAGRGSGFIIDPAGIAITNNHVVTGAGLLRVWVGGESKPRNAKVLGVSECSDLAVIDINGDGFPYLEWHEATPKVGLDVYAAGFPLGEPQFTLTRGVVSKASADGQTSWASVDNVLEHDAKINPGNSGGPLVDKDGRVVGVNYASRGSTDQSYAIAYAEVESLINDLKAGKDVTSIGVNGSAVQSEDGQISGIWVASVKSGSPADKAGVKPGDIITQLEGLVLATDGTMSDYCNVLRTHNSGDTLSLTVLRWSSQEVLEGQLNGRPLEVSYSFFSDQLGSEVQTSDTSTTSYSGYTTVTDDSNAIQLEVPNEWSQVDGRPWNTDWTLADGRRFEFSAPAIAASANLDAYNAGYSESGVFFAASEEMATIGGFIQLLDGVRGWYEADCKFDSRNNYSDQLYEGKYDLWKNCGPDKNWVLVLAARPQQNQTAFLILVEVKITKDADFEALDKILSSFLVGG